MSYGSNHKFTMIYRRYPGIANSIINLQPGENFKLRLPDEQNAIRMCNRLYSFEHAFYGKCKLSIYRRKVEDGWIVVITHPKNEEVSYA